MPVKIHTRPVYLVRHRLSRPGTWYGLHTVNPLTSTCGTVLVAFAEEDHARCWARSLEAHHSEHGAYPDNEFSMHPKRLDWVRRSKDAGSSPKPQDLTLEVVHVPFPELAGALQGSGMSCRVFMDAHDLTRNVDVKFAFDKAAACVRLEAVFAASPADHPM